MLELVTVGVLEEGCFGALKWFGKPFAVSLERTFDDLRTVLKNGRYQCKRDFYHRGQYETFEILVPGHTRVLFHRGNKETDSEACVLIAESFSVLDGQPAIAGSKDGFAEFMSLTAGINTFDLEVSNR